MLHAVIQTSGHTKMAASLDNKSTCLGMVTDLAEQLERQRISCPLTARDAASSPNVR